MKTNKIVASSLFAAMFMLHNASADTAVTEPEAPVAVEEETTVEGDTGNDSCCCSPFGGLFFGLGLGWNMMKLKGEVAGEENGEPVNGLKFAGKYENNSVSKNANRFLATFMLGGGKLWDNGFYAGLNFYFDLGQNKKVSGKLKDVNFKDSIGEVTPRLRMRTGAWSPALALRLGFVPASYNTAMVYLDLGAAYNKAEYKIELLEKGKNDIKKDGEGEELATGWKSASKVTPLVRLGVQKAIGSKFIAGLEVEYKFRASKNLGKLGNDKAEAKDKYKIKRKFADGFTIRLVGTCNFKFN